MPRVAITGPVNLTQLGQELTLVTGVIDIPFKSSWDGESGYVSVLTDAIQAADLETVLASHVPLPQERMPSPGASRMEILSGKMATNTDLTLREVNEMLRLERGL